MITIAVGIIALIGGLVFIQVPSAQAAMKNIARLAIPSIPATINYQGILRETNGNLSNGTYNITAKVYDSATGGNLLYTETLNNVNVRDGLFNIVLGDINPLGTTFEDAPRFIGISLNGGSEIIPRERVHGVPWAVYATHALNATNATNATNAQYLTGFNYANGYSTGDTSSAGASFQNMTVWQQNPNDMVCFLTEVKGAINPFNIPASCSIDRVTMTLNAGPYSFCAALCLQLRP